MNYIAIEGGFYKPKHTLGVFTSHKQVASVIYGKNGSGKSSIARAFLQSTSEEIDTNKEFSNIEFFSLKPHPQQGMDTTASPTITVPTYVHNDKFTSDNLSVSSEGLNTIVMFGEQIEIADELSSLDSELEDINNKKLILHKEIEALRNKKNPDSHLFILEQIKDILKSNWADRYKNISNNTIAGKVDKKILDELFETPLPKLTLTQLMESFKTNLKTYESIQDASPLTELKEVKLTSEIRTLFKELATEIPVPKLTSKEEKILKIIQNSVKSQIDESINLFKSELDTCPTCFNSMDQEYKISNLEMISKVLNTEEANILIKNLNALNIKSILINLELPNTLVETLSPELLNDFVTISTRFNTLINELEKMKLNKIANPYIALSIDQTIYTDLITSINDSIVEINLHIRNFNKQINQKNKLLNSLKILNKEIARIEIDSLLKIYNAKNTYNNNLLSMIEDYEKQTTENRTKYATKIAALENVTIALELINSYLQYIFYDKTRLYLEYYNNYYRIMSRGLPVKPNSLSLGEKNIISLCYFFSTLFKDETISNLFSKKCILVLDDPLSSFDFENKVGVFSFLRYILGELHNGNAESKSLVLTHDLDVLYNLSKVYDDIGIKENDRLKLFNLHNKELFEIKTKNFDEYSILLQNAYEFINSTSPAINDLSIGNNLRRILEAFSTFNYKCGIDGISNNKEVLNKIPPAYRSYFKSSMYRLILNSESHSKDRSKLLLNTSFTEHFSVDEKRKTAKDILMFLYLLDPLHIKIHLKKDRSDTTIIINQIKSWISETFEESLAPQISELV